MFRSISHQPLVWSAWVLGVWVGVLSATPLSAEDPNCKQWRMNDVFSSRTTVEDVKACLEAVGDPMALNDEGGTPLHQAAGSNESPAVIEALLQAGADPMARNWDGETPLQGAAESNPNPAAIEALLQAGVNLSALNDEARTPWPQANERNHNPAIARVLQAAWRGGVLAGSAEGSTKITAIGQPCQVQGYPHPAILKKIGFPWCPASVDFQVRSLAL